MDASQAASLAETMVEDLSLLDAMEEEYKKKTVEVKEEIALLKEEYEESKDEDCLFEARRIHDEYAELTASVVHFAQSIQTTYKI